MSASETAASRDEPDTSVYEAYAQLVKMLLPSSGGLAIYGLDGDLSWSSEGLERPDFREMVDGFDRRPDGVQANQGVIRETSAGALALICRLADDAGETLGFALIELAGTQSSAGRSMAASMTRPLLRCLAAQLASEPTQVPQPTVAAPQTPTQAPPESPTDPRFSFLVGLSAFEIRGTEGLQKMLRYCVDGMDCISAVFCVPDLDLTECAERSGNAETRAQLDATRKHLLAWVQLNNKPMIVNRVDGVKSPYKILSCPVSDQSAKPKGLIALFRSGEKQNFELDDVRVVEFLARQGMTLLAERQDSLSGLMSPSAFESHIDYVDSLSATKRRGALLYFDINDLKLINETFGPSVGDEAILRVARLIRRRLTPDDAACRLGADRFVVHLPDSNLVGAATLGQELVNSAATLGFAARGNRVPISLRYGVAERAAEMTSSRHWIAAAELDCQRAGARQPGAPYNGTDTDQHGD